MPIPMLADFAVRLACGLAVLLAITPARLVPLPFFRTHCQVILGLLVLAALDLAQEGAGRGAVALASVLAGLGYLASVAWGLGLPRAGWPITVLIALGSGAGLVLSSRGPVSSIWALNAAGRLASAALMGSTLTAMLLGHYYLTAPAMSIEPLKRFVRGMAWSLGLRGVLGAVGAWIWLNGRGTPGSHEAVSSLFLMMRWGMGFLGPLLATLLAWKTVQIRSTQSATGILYIAMTLVLFGELTALILSRTAGVIL